LRKSK